MKHKPFVKVWEEYPPRAYQVINLNPKIAFLEKLMADLSLDKDAKASPISRPLSMTDQNPWRWHTVEYNRSLSARSNRVLPPITFGSVRVADWPEAGVALGSSS